MSKSHKCSSSVRVRAILRVHSQVQIFPSAIEVIKGNGSSVTIMLY